MATLHGHGLEAQEEAIMDLWDAALSEAEIAERLGLSAARVRTVTKNMCEGRQELWQYHARAASQRLATAIAAYREVRT